MLLKDILKDLLLVKHQIYKSELIETLAKEECMDNLYNTIDIINELIEGVKHE